MGTPRLETLNPNLPTQGLEMTNSILDITISHPGQGLFDAEWEVHFTIFFASAYKSCADESTSWYITARFSQLQGLRNAKRNPEHYDY